MVAVHHGFKQLSPTHQADVLRMALLHRFGGVWLDLETFAMPSLAARLSQCSDDGVSIPGSQSFIGPLRPNTNFTRAWRDGVHTVLDRPPQRSVRLPRKDGRGWMDVLGLVWDNLAQNLTMDEPPLARDFGLSKTADDDPESRGNRARNCLQAYEYARAALWPSRTMLATRATSPRAATARRMAFTSPSARATRDRFTRSRCHAATSHSSAACIHNGQPEQTS